MDSVSVVGQLRDLASDPRNRRAIVQDEGCLPGLVLFLDHRDHPGVLEPTLQTLRYLAELPANVVLMKNALGLMVSLEKLMNSGSVSGDNIAALAREVHGLLDTPPRPQQPRPPVPRTAQPAPQQQQPATGGAAVVPERQQGRKKPQFFINSTNKKAKSVTLHIQGLESTDQRGLCEEALLKVKGVISFTFQMASKRCTVRIRSDLPTESLAAAIADTKVMWAQQVVHDEAGREVLVSLKPCSVEVQQNSSLPDYLPEEEEEEEEEEGPDRRRRGGGGGKEEEGEGEGDRRAVQRTGAKDDDGSGSWINTAASFLSRTFYW